MERISGCLPTEAKGIRASIDQVIEKRAVHDNGPCQPGRSAPPALQGRILGGLSIDSDEI